eukprot:scaffold1291_cov256-Pinguiococcus_pyrenoidosus.AAC.4
MAKLSVEPLVSKLELFQLYETEQRMYVVASNSERTHFRMLKIMLLPEEDQVRIGSLAEILSEDSTVYSEEDLNHALSDLHVGNSSTGGLKHVLDCYGLVGFNRFIGTRKLVGLSPESVDRLRKPKRNCAKMAPKA